MPIFKRAQGKNQPKPKDTSRQQGEDLKQQLNKAQYNTNPSVKRPVFITLGVLGVLAISGAIYYNVKTPANRANSPVTKVQKQRKATADKTLSENKQLKGLKQKTVIAKYLNDLESRNGSMEDIDKTNAIEAKYGKTVQDEYLNGILYDPSASTEDQEVLKREYREMTKQGFGGINYMGVTNKVGESTKEKVHPLALKSDDYPILEPTTDGFVSGNGDSNIGYPIVQLQDLPDGRKGVAVTVLSFWDKDLTLKEMVKQKHTMEFDGQTVDLNKDSIDPSFHSDPIAQAGGNGDYVNDINDDAMASMEFDDSFKPVLLKGAVVAYTKYMDINDYDKYANGTFKVKVDGQDFKVASTKDRYNSLLAKGKGIGQEYATYKINIRK